jgi:hypothetical protein
MRVDAVGNLLVGQTASGFTNANSVSIQSTAANTGNVVVNHVSGASSGNAYASFGYNGTGIGSITQNGTTAVAYNTSSDVRLKKNIVDAPSAVEKVKALQVRSFDWKADDSHVPHGFVAQELNEVEPLAVTQGETWQIDPSKLVATLTKALQEALIRIEALEAAIKG